MKADLALTITTVLSFSLVALVTNPAGAADPTLEWARTYDGPVSGFDIAIDIETDGSGNVYVLGNSDGGLTGTDCVIAKYDTYGIEEWVSRFAKIAGGAGATDFCLSLAVDDNGNVYITGNSDRTAPSKDSNITAKFGPDGQELWRRRYDGDPGINLSQTGSFVSLDSTGNVYVGGHGQFPRNNLIHNDFTLLKYDPDGALMWERRYGRLDSYGDTLRAMVVGPAGNVFMTGYSFLFGWPARYVFSTVKFDANGNLLWEAEYSGPTTGRHLPIGIAVDGTGQVYVTGESVGESTGVDVATIKYDADGNELWIRRYASAGGAADRPRRIKVDQESNVVIAGSTDAGNLTGDYLTIKYDTFGNELWVNTFDRPEINDNGVVTGLALDAFGGVYVTGRNNSGRLTNYDILTVKYDAEGTVRWTQVYDALNESASTITLDEMSNIYIAGSTDAVTGANDFLTLKYSQVLDRDGDGIPDDIDACPDEDSTGFDVDNDGCIDTINGLASLVNTLVTEGVIDETIANSLLSKVENADMSRERENICAAVNQLEAFQQEVRAQENHKISVEAAEYTIEYADSVIAYLLGLLPEGVACGPPA